jgi:hypothetical protein
MCDVVHLHVEKKAKNNVVLPFKKLLSNGNEFVTLVYMKNLLLFINFPTVYYLLHFDERFKNFHVYRLKHVLCIQKILLNHHEYEKLINTGKLRVFNSFPSIYYLLNSGMWFGSYGQKTAR